MELQGWTLKESEYKETVEAYVRRLDTAQRESFAPLGRLISSSRQGFDMRVLVMTAVGDTQDLSASTIRGLVIFHQDSTPTKSLSTGLKDATQMKIILQHISSINPGRRAEIIDKTLEFVYRETHCSAVRVNLFHIMN